jgi:hypothetical protein
MAATVVIPLSRLAFDPERTKSSNTRKNKSFRDFDDWQDELYGQRIIRSTSYSSWFVPKRDALER